jgi:vancomycin resistance protein YoaR
MKFTRILVILGALILFPIPGYADDVPTSMILKTDFRIWEINPSRLDLFSDYSKTDFAGLTVDLKSDELTMTGGLLAESQVEGIDSMKIRQYLESRIAPDINRDKTDVTIDMDEAENITFEGTGLYGRKLDLEAATRMMEYALKHDIKYVNLPLIREDPVVTVKSEKLKEMGIKELLAGGETDFAHSPYNRITNINVGLSKFQGHIVKPGEEFVFGNTLGVVDGTTGYLKELVIKGDKTVPEYGGGLCQVSTTAYRAVLAAGFPVTERRNHSYAVSYYQPLGLDATVYPPSVEMKFLNDTPNYFVMQTFTEGSKAYYNFYGTKTNRQVHMIGPFYDRWISPPPEKIEYSKNLEPGEVLVVGHAVSGVDVRWYREVTYNDEMTVNEETGQPEKKHFLEKIFSKYQARPDYTIIGSEDTPPDR